MSTSAATLIQRTRRLLRDWPEEDVTTASISSVGTTLTIGDGTIYPKSTFLELDQEVLYTTAAGSGTTVAVRRGLRGSTAASHASGASILINPSFYSIEILDALNQALDACYPLIYRPVATEYTGVSDTIYEYTLPTMSGISVAIPSVYRIDVQESGDLAFRNIRAWEVIRSEAPFIKFRRPPTAGSTVRVYGYGPFTHLSAISDTLDTYFPVNAEFLLSDFAAAQLLASGEAFRVRSNKGVVDARENANATGSSLRAAENFRNRFYAQLQNAAMPPMRRHVPSVI